MTVRILVGDCREVMAGMEPDSVDAIVTDPPYALTNRVPDVKKCRDCGRVLGGADGKPDVCPRCGGELYNQRSQGGGFMGKKWDSAVPGIDVWREAYRVLKPGGHMLAFGGTRTHHRLMVAIEDAGFEIRDCLMWLYGSGFPKSHNLKDDWQGWGTALKPAYELIILARKPLIGSVAANVTQYGTGGLNVDGCRIPHTPGIEGKWGVANTGNTRSVYGSFADESGLPGSTRNDAGRWPANVVLNEDAAAMLDAQSGITTTPKCVPQPSFNSPTGQIYGFQTGKGRNGEYAELPGDTGGASRFFYTAKASRAERNKGLEGMPEFKPHPDEPNGRVWDIPGSHSTARANHHPTVKPLSLMQWLVRLVTPPNGTVLDCFGGSGSTMIAADREGFHGIYIDLDEEYAEIARRRIHGDAPLFAHVTTEGAGTDG